jgi:beta-N-acetylhexosaminidase
MKKSSLLAVTIAGLLGLAAAPPYDLADTILEQMTPEERVGQLFLITFRGSSLAADAAALDLIRNSHVSGIVLRSENDNFTGPDNTITAAHELIQSLQTAEYEASQRETDPGVYVPLLIGIIQEGNGPPYSALMDGLSPLPSEMAIGATWDAELARQVGEVLGSELQAVGFNLVLGPSLDVLEDPQQLGLGDLGVRAFGGDPYWVGVMGRAYIEGLQSGSDGALGVIAKHFPGLGGSDRPIQEEASTVRKSLVQLQQIELAPFFAVTDAAPGEASGVADGLLTGHIRYQGFQGNIRDTTRPISLDPDAFGQLMQLEQFASWRASGGVTISGELGSGAIRRFNESLGQSYRAHLVARDAFLAGNDLLFLSDFQSEGDPDQLTTILSTLSFFSEKYRDDALFAQRVDEAVLRILRFKMRLYDGAFEVGRVLQEEPDLGLEVSDVALSVARAGATLLSPSVDEIPAQVGEPPQIGERIVFISDVRAYAQCSNCDVRQSIGLTQLEDTILSLYGTGAAGQVGAWNLTSLSLADLALFLGQDPVGPPAVPLVAPEEVDQVLRPADWLIFVTLKSDPGVFGSGALKLLLDTRPDLARNKRVVVFALDVPYDLGATDVSKIDLYYGLYGKTDSFIEVAARLLFQELSAAGASPVSVPGIGYDLIEVTSPDPSQLITLIIPAESEGTEAPRGFAVGDVVQVMTGEIQDHNGNRVPDGTPVEFLLSYQGDGVELRVEATTIAGIAETAITLDRLGVLNIEASSEPARISEILQLNVQEGIVTVITPTVEATETAIPSATPEPATATPVVGAERPPIPPEASRGVGLGDLALAVPAIIVLAAIGNALIVPNGSRATETALIILAGGLVGYNYLALGMPGSEMVLERLDIFAGPAAASVGAALAGLVVLIRYRGGIMPLRR